MMEPLQFIGGGALLLVLVAAWRSVVRQRPRSFDLGTVSNEWRAQLWRVATDPGLPPENPNPQSGFHMYVVSAFRRTS